MSRKIPAFLSSFLSEGLIGQNSMPIDTAKLDPNQQQNLTAKPQPVAQIDPLANQQTTQPGIDQKSPTQENPKKEDEKKEETPDDHLDEVQAAHSGLLLAEYHLNKLCSSLTEGEDIDLDKLRGTKEILTDARKTMFNYWSKKKEKPAPVEPVKESVERSLVSLPKNTSFTVYQVKPDGSLANKEHLNNAEEVSEWYGQKNYGHICIMNDKTGEKMFFQDTEGGLMRESATLAEEVSEEEIRKNPAQLIKNPLDKNDFVVAGERVFPLSSEKMLETRNGLFLLLKPNMVATIRNEMADDILFKINETYYKMKKDDLSNLMKLIPLKAQSKGPVVWGLFAKKEFDKAKAELAKVA